MDDHPPATLSESLLAAYRQAEYRVHAEARGIVLTVGHASAELDDELARLGAAHAALITACNPFSQPLSTRCNQRRSRRLRLALTGLGLAGIDATNRDPSGRWPDEASRLIVDISLQTADSLAERFGQWAYLWLERGRPVRLRARRTSGSPYRWA